MAANAIVSEIGTRYNPFFFTELSAPAKRTCSTPLGTPSKSNSPIPASCSLKERILRPIFLLR